MKKYFYPAIFSKEGDAYNVKFIDFDDVFTYGVGFDDAYYMAQDALYAMLPEYKDRLPEPTFNYMDIKVKDGDFITMVELDPIEHEENIFQNSKYNSNYARVVKKSCRYERY